MKTKPPPPRTPEQPIINLDRLRQYLENKGYRDRNHEPELCVASVMEFHPDNHHPYGMASYRGQVVSFRQGHFHRIETISADISERFRIPEADDFIWVMVGVYRDGKKIAIAWGFVDELPLGFTPPVTLVSRVLRRVDSVYRKWRNWSWRGIFKRAERRADRILRKARS